MTRINVRREFGLIRLFDADGNILATFTKSPVQLTLFTGILSDLATNGGYEVYDEDRMQFIVGDLSQLATHSGG